MPRINDPAEIEALAVAPADSRLLFRERLMNLFAAHEWVRVINVDDETYIWQYMPPHAEDFEFTPDPMKITRRGDAELYRLDPGDSEVLLGENAYIMIEGLYKKLVSKKVVERSPDMAPGQARSFNWTDGNLQELWIKKIYLGKEKLSFDTPPEAVIKSELSESIDSATPANTGRMRKTV